MVSLVTLTWYIPYVLLQVLLLVQLPMSIPLLRPAPSSPEGRPSSSQCAPAIPKSPARDYSQGYRTSRCGLTDNFPTERNSLTELPQKAAALSIPPSQTGEVLQATGTIAFWTPRGVQFAENWNFTGIEFHWNFQLQGSPICRKYPFFCMTHFQQILDSHVLPSPETVLPI